MNDKNEIIISKIAELIYDGCEYEAFDSIKLTVCKVLTFAMETIDVVVNGKYVEPMDIPNDITMLTDELRQIMYSQNPKNGAWYTMILEINEDGNFSLKFDYDNEPDFSIEIDKERYKKDLEFFPREVIPEWLRKKIK